MKTKKQCAYGLAILLSFQFLNACSTDESDELISQIPAMPQQPLGNSLPRALVVGATSDAEKLNISSARGQVLTSVSRDSDLSITSEYLIEKKTDQTLSLFSLRTLKSAGTFQLGEVEGFRLAKSFIAYKTGNQVIAKALNQGSDAEPLLNVSDVQDYQINDHAVAILQGQKLTLFEIKGNASKKIFELDRVSDFQMSQHLLVTRDEESNFRLTRMNGDTHQLRPARPSVESFDLNDQFLVFAHSDEWMNKYIDVLDVSRAHAGVLRPVANLGAQQYVLTRNAVVYVAPTHELVALGIDGRAHLRARVTTHLDQVQITDDLIVYREAFLPTVENGKNPVHVYRIDAKKSEFISEKNAVDDYIAIDDMVLYRESGETIVRVLGASGYRGEYKIAPSQPETTLNFNELKSIHEVKLKKLKLL